MSNEKKRDIFQRKTNFVDLVCFQKSKLNTDKN